MIAKLDKSGCIACGLCVDICPEVFRMGDDDLAEVWVDEVPEELEANVMESLESCPVSVITVE